MHCFFILILSACNTDDNEAPKVIDTFHEFYYDTNILPSLTTFKNEVEQQLVFTTSFTQNKSLTNLTLLQLQWLKLAKTFSKTRAYNLVAVKALFFDTLIYNFPASTSIIESNIESKINFTPEFISQQSSSAQGLATMEYLLFGNNNTNNAFNMLVADNFRVNYLQAVTNQVLTQTNALIRFWEDNYKNEFINARSTSCVDNARCLAFNQLINILDVTRVTKLGKPAGLEGSTNINLTGLEAFRSRKSLALIKSTVEEVEQAYTLSTVNFSGLVNNISGNISISKQINSVILNIYNHINALDDNLYVAIENKDPNVGLLYDALTDLVKYLSVDAASILSVSVLPTDNDGD